MGFERGLCKLFMEEDKPIDMESYLTIISEVGFMSLLRKGGALAIRCPH